MCPKGTAQLRIPWVGEFTPGQLGRDALEETLAIVERHSGDRDAIVEAIRERWFTEAAQNRTDPGDRLHQQRTRAGNVLNGMQSYGLVDRAYELSELGRELWTESDTRVRDRRFVAHLIKDRQGLELLDLVRELQQRGVKVTKDQVNAELRSRGYRVTVNSADAGKLRQWLGTAGVIDDKWVIDENRLAEVAGTSLDVVAEWQSMSRVDRAFLVTLRRLCETRGKAPIPSPEFLDFVRAEHGPVYDEGRVGRVYQRLSNAGWITHTVKRAGRGGKGGEIAVTDKLIEVDFELLVGFQPGALPADLRAVMRTPRDQIYDDLRSSDTHTKGIALELLAVNIATDLGLQPLRLRVRGVRTGGAEVDLLAEGAHLHFSRWLFQCKNTKTVNVSALAKEVGMATLLDAQVIVIATTGKVSTTVETYAKRISETTQFQVVLVDHELLNAYRSGGALSLRDGFRQQAVAAMRLKRPQVLETLDEMAEDDA